MVDHFYGGPDYHLPLNHHVVLGFLFSSKSKSSIEFEGSLTFNVMAIRHFVIDLNFTFSTMPIYGVTPGAQTCNLVHYI